MPILAPDGRPGSMDGQSFEMTMRAEVGQLTLEQAIASGLFDLADQPGMIRVPVSVQVTIPTALLGAVPQDGAGEG